MSVGMIYIKTRKEHPFLSALEINYLQKTRNDFRLDSNQHVLTDVTPFPKYYLSSIYEIE